MRDGETKQIDFSVFGRVSKVRGEGVIVRVVVGNFFRFSEFQSDVAEFDAGEIDFVGDVVEVGPVQFGGIEEVGQAFFGGPEMGQRIV